MVRAVRRVNACRLAYFSESCGIRLGRDADGKPVTIGGAPVVIDPTMKAGKWEFGKP